ncbi:MAG: threonine--tRNA ligase [Pirellulaceae bacterium]|nr:MAG: threonine--tRNA ligase [Pirellulaceae bacterium]
MEVRLPDGSVIEVPDDATAWDVAERLGGRWKATVVAAEVAGSVVDATRPLAECTPLRPVPLRLLTERDPESLAVLRHSCAHVMARAVMRLFPDVSLAFGPTTGQGFYYDFDLPQKIREEDFPRIEEEMARIIAADEPFERLTLPRDEAIALCEQLRQPLKVEHIRTGLADHAELGFYRQGEFIDLCRGPHIPSAGRIKAFKLLSVAGAYWKGDARNRQLQRLYGTAWFQRKDLEAYLKQLEEAQRRDHRVLGRQLGLFHIEPDRVGQGLCLWLPKGATVRMVLEEFLRKEMLRRGYQPVYTPHVARVEIYQTSGHFPYYRDAQFAPIFQAEAGQLVDSWIQRLEQQALDPDNERRLLEAARLLGASLDTYDVHAPVAEKLKQLRDWERRQERYLLKPMNCPHHIEIYRSAPRSYRDLPLRLFEFGTVYRHEQSGELNGMLRVRGLTQDDAHIFCTAEQVEEEFRATLDLTRFVLGSVGLHDYRVQLSLRDPTSDKYVGSPENWQRAEAALRKVLEDSGLAFVERRGEAAFYGPKADFMVRDCIGRQWQLGTVQLDYNLPERFQLEYIGPDNRPHRPVMIHRAPFGSLERFVGMLIEHFAGAFPLWLAPEQVRVLPLSEKSNDYALQVRERLRDAGFRVGIDLRNAKVQAKIRDAQLELIPYMFVVGPREAEVGAVAVRDRLEGDLGAVPLGEAIERLRREVDERRVRQTIQPIASQWEDGQAPAHEY